MTAKIILIPAYIPGCRVFGVIFLFFADLVGGSRRFATRVADVGVNESLIHSEAFELHIHWSEGVMNLESLFWCCWHIYQYRAHKRDYK